LGGIFSSLIIAHNKDALQTRVPVRQVGADDDVVVSDAEGNPDLTVEEELVKRTLSHLKTIPETLTSRFDP